MNGKPKKGQDAQKWDEKSLKREQFLIIQPIYDKWVKYNPKLGEYLQTFAWITVIASIVINTIITAFEGAVLAFIYPFIIYFRTVATEKIEISKNESRTARVNEAL